MSIDSPVLKPAFCTNVTQMGGLTPVHTLMIRIVSTLSPIECTAESYRIAVVVITVVIAVATGWIVASCGSSTARRDFWC